MPVMRNTLPRLVLQLTGLVLAIAGLTLTIAPTLLHDPGPAASTYDAIERRIWWGGLFGLGVLLMIHHPLKPLLYSLSAAVFWIIGGLLVARFIGLALDGHDSVIQWIWVVLEGVIIFLAWLAIKKFKPVEV